MNIKKIAWFLGVIFFIMTCALAFLTLSRIFLRLGAIEKNYSGLASRVSTLEEKVKKIDLVCEQLRNDIGSLNEKISSANQEITKTKNEMSQPSRASNNVSAAELQNILQTQIEMKKQLEELAAEKKIALENAEALKKTWQSDPQQATDNLKSVLSLGYLGGGGGVVFDQELPFASNGIKTGFRTAAGIGNGYSVYNFGLEGKKESANGMFYGASADYAYYSKDVSNIPLMSTAKEGNTVGLGVFIGKKLSQSTLFRLGYNWALGITGQIGYQF